MHDSACDTHFRGCRCRFRYTQNTFQRFDGNKPHFTCKFLGERYALLHSSVVCLEYFEGNISQQYIIGPIIVCEQMCIIATSSARYTVVYYIHQSWEKCRIRGLLESLGFPFPGSEFKALVKARDQYPSTHDRIQEAMKDLILDQDQHEGESGATSRYDHLSLGSYDCRCSKPGTIQEPVEVIDYSSDEDFVQDGNEPGGDYETPLFASPNHREPRALKAVAI